MILLDPSSYKRKGGITQIKYGYLYNQWATQDQGEYRIVSDDMVADGWIVPTDTDWTTLTNYINTTYNIAPNNFGVGNHLKSRRQVNSPLGSPWATNEHPRWNASASNYGRDTVNLNLLPSGYRQWDNTFTSIGEEVYYWSSTIYAPSALWYRYLYYNDFRVLRNPGFDDEAFSIRCMRNATIDEQSLNDGAYCNPYIGSDDKIYKTVKIGTQVWMAENLAETKWSNGDWINGFNDGVYTPIANETWAALTTAALCAYNNDLTLV
jgi:uncharacterized protein (TIGR02145 family)